jgi:hypothetical protein
MLRPISDLRFVPTTEVLSSREDERGAGVRQGSAFFVGRFRNTQSSPIPLRRHRDARFNQVGSKAKPLALGGGPRFSSERPLWVKGGCGRQTDGTAGLTPAPEMPRTARHLRFVPQADSRECK